MEESRFFERCNKEEGKHTSKCNEWEKGNYRASNIHYDNITFEGCSLLQC